MSDIVERLRAKELLSIEEDGHTHFLPKNPDGDDGAAEIERLRAENEKLREALTDAAGELQHAYIMGFTERYRDAAKAARAAAAAIRESEAKP